MVTLMYGNSSDITGNIVVYPNPVRSAINLSIYQSAETPPTPGQSALPGLNNSPVRAAAPAVNAGPYTIKIANITGSVIKTASSATNAWQAGVGNLPPGTYIIQVFNKGDNKLVGKSTFVKL